MTQPHQHSDFLILLQVANSTFTEFRRNIQTNCYLTAGFWDTISHGFLIVIEGPILFNCDLSDKTNPNLQELIQRWTKRLKIPTNYLYGAYMCIYNHNNLIDIFTYGNIPFQVQQIKGRTLVKLQHKNIDFRTNSNKPFWTHCMSFPEICTYVKFEDDDFIIDHRLFEGTFNTELLFLKEPTNYEIQIKFDDDENNQFYYWICALIEDSVKIKQQIKKNKNYKQCMMAEICFCCLDFRPLPLSFTAVYFY